MKRIARYTAELLLLLACTVASGQNSQVLYYMNLPQNHFLNPAMRPSNSLYIGLPGMSGINLNMNNNFVNFSDVIVKGPEGSLVTFLHPDYDISKFLSKIKNSNSIEPEAMVQIFGLGFSAGKSYISFDVNERAEGNMVIPGDLFRLALEGNEAFLGKSIDLSSLRGDIKYFREAAIGYSRELFPGLRAGVRIKYLGGIAAVSIKNRGLSVTVNDDYSHTFDADITMNFSAPVQIYRDGEGIIDSIAIDDDRLKDIVTSPFPRNSGFGIDLGVVYSLTNKINVSASLTDFGYIRWKNDVTNLKSKNSFLYSGLNITDVVNGDKEIEDVANELLDSLKTAFDPRQTSDPFSTLMPFGFTVGGSYNLTKSFSVGVISYSRFIGKQVRQSLTFSGNLNLGNAFSTSISYSASNHRWDNIGAGIAFRLGVVQFYMLSDRIPISWNRIKDGENSFLVPYSWNSVNLRLGMNLVFGNRVKKKNDIPMIDVNDTPEL